MAAFTRALSKIISGCLIQLVNGYQLLLSPIVGRQCRFYPSCSHYAKQALQQHRLFYALGLIVKRLIKCHPGHPGGIDEVPIR